jgi:hypothetical protein
LLDENAACVATPVEISSYIRQPRKTQEPEAFLLTTMTTAAEDLALVASLALADVDLIQARRKGKAQDGTPLTDEELAFQLFAEEASSLLALARDAIFAESIDRALETDRPALRTYAAAEARETRDRDIALSLSGQSRAASIPYATSKADQDPSSLLDALDKLSVYSE